MARMALARSGRDEPEAAVGAGALLNGTVPGTSSHRHAAVEEPVHPKAVERALSEVISPVGIASAVAVLLIAVGWMLFGGEDTASELAVREADESAPVDVQHVQPQNLFNEAMRSFGLIARGELGVQVPGEKRRTVEEYFASNGITYAVSFPIARLPLTGGIVTRYGGRAFAQLVYSNDQHAVYVLQVPVDEVRSGKRLYIMPDVLARLEKGEKIREMTPEGESLVMLRQGDVVITAVGNMAPEELEALVRGS